MPMGLAQIRVGEIGKVSARRTDRYLQDRRSRSACSETFIEKKKIPRSGGPRRAASLQCPPCRADRRHVDACIYVGMRIGMRIASAADMHVDTGLDMRMDMCVCMCTDMVRTCVQTEA